MNAHIGYRLLRATGALLLGLTLAVPAGARDGDRGVGSLAHWEEPAHADADAAQQLVDDARVSLQAFFDDPQQEWLHQNLADARALLVVPKMVRAGFGFVGGSGGQGLLMVRDPVSGWSMPAFYLIGAASIGLEIGVQRVEALLVATTDAGVEALMHGKLQLGVGVSVAAGPVGRGAQAASADVMVFERSMGLYGGLAFEGAGVIADGPRNRAYYGRDLGVDEILRSQAASNDGALPLLESLENGTRG